MNKIFRNLLATGVIVASVFSAQSQQQQWASQYVHWEFDNSPSSVWNIDQDVWLMKSADKSFWPVQWSWKNANGVGGYLGLQQEDSTLQRARFSLWNATEAVAGPNASSRTFGGEGIGYTCELPFEINEDYSYKYRLWRLDADNSGQWWGAWLIETDNEGNVTEHSIGKIKVAKDFNQIDIGSISNFVEFYGGVQEECIDVPSSVIVFSPPRVNSQGEGKYESTSTFKNSTKANGNICSSGSEGAGAIIKALQFPVSFGMGALMTMGTPAAMH